MRNTIIAALASFGLMTGAALAQEVEIEEDGPLEETGEAAGELLEETGEAAGEAAEATGDAVDEAEDELDDDEMEVEVETD